MKPRDGGVEVFRCLMMFLVVMNHVSSQGVFGGKPEGLPIFALTFFAVPGFLAISGWYGIRFTWKKWFMLWGMTAFYSVLSFALAGVAVHLGWLPKLHEFKIYGGWFIGVYLALMLLAPILNAGLEEIYKTSSRALLYFWTGLIFLMFFAWLPSVGVLFKQYAGGEIAGMGCFSIITVCVTYMTLRIARLFEADKVLSTKCLWWVLAILVIAFIMVVNAYAQITWSVNPKANCGIVMRPFGYHVPFVFLASAVALLLFQRWRPPSWLTRVCAFLGPSMLAVYLLHVCSESGKILTFRMPTTWVRTHWSFLPDWCMVLCVVTYCFFLCVGIDLLRRGVWHGMKKLYARYMTKDAV